MRCGAASIPAAAAAAAAAAAVRLLLLLLLLSPALATAAPLRSASPEKSSAAEFPTPLGCHARCQWWMATAART